MHRLLAAQVQQADVLVIRARGQHVGIKRRPVDSAVEDEDEDEDKGEEGEDVWEAKRSGRNSPT